MFLFCSINNFSFHSDVATYGLTISSTPRAEGRSVCPNQIITFTCTADHTSVMQWLAPPTLVSGSALSLRLAEGEGTVIISHDGVFTLTLVSVMNLEGPFADLTSTLEFLVSAVENGTEVECRSDTQTQSITLLIACKLNRSM